VLVIPYELLKRNQADFISHILRFLNLPLIDHYETKSENTSESMFGLSYLRIYNKLSNYLHTPTHRRLYMALTHADQWVPKSIHQTSYESSYNLVSKYFRSRFRECNFRLQENFSIDLQQFGYEM
jgi:hypothetical protein